MMTLPLMTSALGNLTIRRVPYSRKETLQAFDQADILALDYLHDENLLSSTSRVLVINDSFAAITSTVSMAMVSKLGPMPVLWSDSYLAKLGLQANAKTNDLPQAGFVQAQDTPQGPFDMVILRLPKSHGLLLDQIQRLLPQLAANALIIMPVMVKHIDNAVYQLLESALGELTTSLARKKARLMFASQLVEGSRKSPSAAEVVWDVPTLGLSLQHYSGVFGRTKLDPGAQVLLDNFPQGPYQRVIDLGCGNGVQAIAAAKKWPLSQVMGVDESYMSVASASLNAASNGVAAQCEFKAGDCLTDMNIKFVDLILCNPPFHQERVVGDQIAMRMFAQAAKVLTPEGELWVVGNRHLGYHAKLKRWFKRVEQIGAHPKFVVLKARL